MLGKGIGAPLAIAVAAAVISAGALLAAPVARAGDISQSLEARINAMERELQALKGELAKAKSQAEAATKAAKTAQRAAENVQRKARVAIKEARAEDNSTIKWHLGGFGTGDFTVTNAPGVDSTFEGGSFNPIFLVSYKDLLFWEAELEVSTQSDASTKLELEFANLNLNATDWLTFTLGKFLSPIGDFQSHLHPTWINKLPDRPAGFVEDGGSEPLGDVGLQARGAFPVGSITMDYAIYVGNGPQIAAEGLNLEGNGSDNNNDKAVGGRLGIRPIPFLSIGISGLRAGVRGKQPTNGSITTADYVLGGADIAYTKGPWDLRGEYLISHLDRITTGLEDTDTTPTDVPATTWRAWYVQAAYRLSGLTSDPILGNFEPVFRFSQFGVTGFADFKALAENRYTIGLNYWFAPSIVAKIAFERRILDNKRNESVGRFQAAFGF